MNPTPNDALLYLELNSEFRYDFEENKTIVKNEKGFQDVIVLFGFTILDLICPMSVWFCI